MIVSSVTQASLRWWKGALGRRNRREPPRRSPGPIGSRFRLERHAMGRKRQWASLNSLRLRTILDRIRARQSAACGNASETRGLPALGRDPLCARSSAACGGTKNSCWPQPTVALLRGRRSSRGSMPPRGVHSAEIPTFGNNLLDPFRSWGLRPPFSNSEELRERASARASEPAATAHEGATGSNDFDPAFDPATLDQIAQALEMMGRATQESNLRPTAPEAVALSN
jgi:hypothetical protein